MMFRCLHARESRPASVGWALVKTLSWMVVFWTVFLLLIPIAIVQIEAAVGLDQFGISSHFIHLTGWSLFTLGALLGIASAFVMAIHGQGTPLPIDCAPKLVVRGPYRYVRNPMAIAGLLQGVAVGLILGSPFVVGYAVIGGPIWNYGVRPWEEADLAARFGEPYRAYRRAVWCWWPRWSAYAPSPADFSA